MPIKFPNLLQESWNFIRNQRQFSLSAFILLFVLQLVHQFLFSYRMNVAEIADGNNPQFSLSEVIANLFPTLIFSIVSLWATLMMILNIKAINNGQNTAFFAQNKTALNKLFTAVLISFAMSLPMAMGSSFLMFTQMNGGAEMSILGLPLLVSGIYFFLKWCLAIYAYLIEDLQGVKNSLRFAWQLTKGKMLPMILFCIMTYMLPTMLMSLIGRVIPAAMTIPVSALCNAFFTLFVTVFSFRFYQVYKQMPAKN